MKWTSHQVLPVQPKPNVARLCLLNSIVVQQTILSTKQTWRWVAGFSITMTVAHSFHMTMELFQAFATQATLVGGFIVGFGLVMGIADKNKEIN